MKYKNILILSIISASMLSMLTIGNVYSTTVPVDALLTADNHYALFTGDSDGTYLEYIGRNELGGGGAPGTYNWSYPETFSFDMRLGDHIYIAGWSDDSVAQGLIGQFDLPSSQILTNDIDWEVFLTWNDLDGLSTEPTEAEMKQQITLASWNPIEHVLPHGSSPWGKIDGISDNAQWIWGSDLIPGSNYGEYQIFRTKVAKVTVIPEPSSLIMLSLGLLGTGFLKRFRKR